MDLKLTPEKVTPVSVESSVILDVERTKVFDFVANHFHENYRKWMPDVVEMEFLDGLPVAKGFKVKQVRLENDEEVESTFEITEYQCYDKFAFEGIDMPYRHVYRFEALGEDQTQLFFRFELLEIDLFMRPFIKLIRVAAVEGVEETIQKLNEALSNRIN